MATKSMENQSKPKKPRASKPKVKTGCITCKIRRVKCDEAKPFCNRCQKFGAQCDGYQEEKTEKPRAKSLAPILPRPSPGRQLLPSIRSPGSEQEQQYLYRFFQNEAPSLSLLFRSNFWTRILLEASRSEPAVRHAIIAVMALSQARAQREDVNSYFSHQLNLDELLRTSLSGSRELSDGFPGTPQSSSLRRNREEQQDFAMGQYDKAVFSLQECAADGTSSSSHIRTALIVCPLLVGFESLQGAFGLAAAQINCGVMMINGGLAVEAHLKQDINGRLSSNGGNVESEIIDMFAQLDIHGKAQHPKMPKNPHEAATSPLCRAFSNFVKARESWDLYMDQTLLGYAANCPLYAGNGILSVPRHFQRINMFKEDFNAQYHFWTTMVRPLLEDTSGFLRSEQSEHLVLSAFHLIVTMILNASPNSAHFINTDFGTEFAFIISTVPVLMQNQNYEFGLRSSTDFVFIPALYMVATKSMDHLLRNHATTLLLKLSTEQDDSRNRSARRPGWFISILEDIANQEDTSSVNRNSFVGSSSEASAQGSPWTQLSQYNPSTYPPLPSTEIIDPQLFAPLAEGRHSSTPEFSQYDSSMLAAEPWPRDGSLSEVHTSPYSEPAMDYEMSYKSSPSYQMYSNQ